LAALLLIRGVAMFETLMKLAGLYGAAFTVVYVIYDALRRIRRDILSNQEVTRQQVEAIHTQMREIWDTLYEMKKNARPSDDDRAG
jgi:hypothetical protein